ncbi:hypothetical protein GCM10020229_22310 [Kitasatospora albolonga]
MVWLKQDTSPIDKGPAGKGGVAKREKETKGGEGERMVREERKIEGGWRGVEKRPRESQER